MVQYLKKRNVKQVGRFLCMKVGVLLEVSRHC